MNFPPQHRGSLIPETAATLIERELARFLALANGFRLKQPLQGGATPDLPALRAFRRKAIFDFELRYVQAVGHVFRFDSYADGDDNGIDVIRPTDAQGLGRWLREGASAAQRTTKHQGVRDAAIRLDRWARQPTGFAKTVRLWEGEFDDEAIAELFARRPCYVVVPSGSEHEAKSLIPGAYYKETFRYRVWGVSQDLRRGPAGMHGQGSVLGEMDPGLNYVMGAIKRTLAGSTLGLLGVVSVEIGNEEVVAHDLANRVFCNSLELRVTATLHLPDDDIVPLTAVTTTTELIDTGEADEVDLANYVAAGCYPDRFGPLLTTIRAGACYIAGRLVVAAAWTATLPPDSEVYRDLRPDGSWVIQSVAVGSLPPPLEDKALRIGVTTTDGAGTTTDRFLCSTMLELVGPDRIPKE